MGYSSTTSCRPTEPEQGTTLSRSRVLVIMGSYFLLTGALQAFVPLRASALGADGAILGLLLVLAGGGIGLVTDLGFASYADARGRDKVVFGGFLCTLIAVSLVVLNGSIAVLFIGCFLAGLGNSAVFDSLLALLSTTRHHHTQTRTQGFNVSVQRLGALLAALTIGLTLASQHDEILALTAGGACLVPLLVMYSRASRPGRCWTSLISKDAELGAGQLLIDGYRQGFKMFRRRKIVMAALVSVAVNLIFIETNSFVPLIGRHHGVRQALFITAALVARDLVAIAVGVLTVATGKDASSAKAVMGVLCLAAVSAAGVGLDAGGSNGILVLWCALQGVAIGVGVAAMNLLTVGASSEANRSLGMAAATLLNRAGVVVIPIGLGLTLQLIGLRFVFLAVAGALLFFSLMFVGTALEIGGGRRARQETQARS